MPRRSRTSSTWWSWDDRPERSSPLPADGIKARTRAGQAFGQTWWGGKWIEALERLVNPGRLQRGRSYARKGQVLNIDFEENHVSSRVQGTRSDPYQVSIEVKSIDDARWNRVIGVMASQAIFAAKLLAGEMPQDIEEAFSSAGVALFPERSADLRTECSCPDNANPCKHISAVYYLLGEQFDADPFLLFQLRGRSKEQIIADLRTRRGAFEGTAPPAGISSAKSDSVTADQGGQRPGGAALEAGSPGKMDSGYAGEQSAALEESLDRFWDVGVEIDSMQFTIARPEVDAATIKLLGQPPFWDEKRDFIAEMESMYRAISEAAMKTALED